MFWDVINPVGAVLMIYVEFSGILIFAENKNYLNIKAHCWTLISGFKILIQNYSILITWNFKIVNI